MQQKSAHTPEPDYTIEISTKDNYVLPPKMPHLMKVGQTVRYRSSHGAVTIKFPEHSPYRLDHVKKTSVPGEVILTLVSANEGDGFPSRCYITLPSDKGKKAKKIGWSKDNYEAGGVHKVGH